MLAAAFGPPNFTIPSPSRNCCDTTPVGCNTLRQQKSSILVEQALGLIQPRQRRAIELTYYEGLTANQISEVTGESIRVVRGTPRKPSGPERGNGGVCGGRCHDQVEVTVRPRVWRPRARRRPSRRRPRRRGRRRARRGRVRRVEHDTRRSQREAAVANEYARRFGTPSGPATSEAASRADSTSRQGVADGHQHVVVGCRLGLGCAVDDERRTRPAAAVRVAHATASANVPRTTSSCSLVSSRATATRRSGPNAPARSASVRSQPVGRLVQHDRAALGCQRGQPLRSPARPCGAGSPRTRTGRSAARSPPARRWRPTDRARPRPRSPARGRGAHQPLAGIGDARRAGVGDDGDALAARQPGEHVADARRPRCGR